MRRLRSTLVITYHFDWRKKRSLESKTLLVQLSPAPEPHIEETGALSKTSERCRRTYLASDSHCTVGNHETLDCVVTNTCVIAGCSSIPCNDNDTVKSSRGVADHEVTVLYNY